MPAACCGGSLAGRSGVRRSAELEGMLRGPLGDPGLRLGFWQAGTLEWVDADGTQLAPPRSDQRLTEVDLDGRAAIAIVHDQQLVDDPELLRAAGAVALLALQNAELDAAWKDSVSALADSRARLTRASDTERRKLERDLHDGAQQRLLAALIRLSAVDELTGDTGEVQRQVAAARAELETAIDELRDLARGIYPTVLAEIGLAGALQSVALRSPERVTVQATDQRFAPELEVAFYYCCLEAVQNALKHAGSEAHTSIRLSTTDHELRLEVRDTGPGFDPTARHDGLGLQSMQDRLGAVGGRVEIGSRVGRGTVVTARAPIASRSNLDALRALTPPAEVAAWGRKLRLSITRRERRRLDRRGRAERDRPALGLLRRIITIGADCQRDQIGDDHSHDDQGFIAGAGVDGQEGGDDRPGQTAVRGSMRSPPQNPPPPPGPERIPEGGTPGCPPQLRG